MMVWLDTNAFYYVAGLSENHHIDLKRLQDYLSFSEVAISGHAFFEFISRFKDQRHQLERGLYYLQRNDLKICDQKSHILSIESVESICDSIDSLSVVVTKYKIDNESPYPAMLLSVCIECGLYFFACKERGKPNELQMRLISSVFFNVLKKKTPDLFIQIYKEAYSQSEDCEKYIRSNFDKLLAFYLGCLLPIIEKADKEADNNIPLDEYLNQINWNPLQERFWIAIERKDTSTDYLRSLTKKYWKKTSDVLLHTFLDQLLPSFEQKFGKGALYEYLTILLRRMLTDGKTFHKNDIIDAMILDYVRDCDSIITFDKGMINHMLMFQVDSPSYQRSLALLDEFGYL